MERVAVAGLSLHQTDVGGLERIKRGLAALEEPLAKGLADRLGASEMVVLSTCNRCEVLYARETGHAPTRDDLETLAEACGLERAHPLRARFFLHTGRSAARHMLRVVASLDSLVLGEDQILAQMRAAYAEAQELGLSGRILGPLLEQVIGFGKRVRTETDLSRHPVSVVSLGVAFLSERVPAGARIAVIGAGATGAHAARALVAAGHAPTFIVNRSQDRAQALAEEVGARVLTLDALRKASEPLDAIVSATSAPAPVLDAAALRRLSARVPHGGRLVTVDLALPRDLEPCSDANIVAIDLETLRGRADENRALRASAAATAEVHVEEALAQLAREHVVDALTGPYSAIVEQARETFELELTRLGQGRLAHLPARDRLAVERWARVAFGRIAHVPFHALKRLARGVTPRNGHAPVSNGDWEGLE